jgi:hypothetical protein
MVHRSIAPGSEETCRAFFLQQKIALHQSIFEDGTKGFWLGNPRAKTVMLFLHGENDIGNLMCQTNKCSRWWLCNSSDCKSPQALERCGLSSRAAWAICRHFVPYIWQVSTKWTFSKGISSSQNPDLAPAAQYPHQLGQALHAYRFLVEDQKRAPGTVGILLWSLGRACVLIWRQIILAGDSAGGNLALGLLACLTHPRSDIPGVASNEALKATILISPWVTFETTALSFTRNRYKDALDAAAITQWSKNYIGDKAIDGYVCPLMAPEGWWKGAKTGDICVIAGAEELFVDDIDRFVKVLKVCWPQVNGTDPVFFLTDTDEPRTMAWRRRIGVWLESHTML